MPKRRTTRAAKANAARMPGIPSELPDQIEKQGPMTAETILQASMVFKKALIGHAMSGEMSHTWAMAAGRTSPKGSPVTVTARAPGTVLTEDGPLHVEVPGTVRAASG